MAATALLKFAFLGSERLPESHLLRVATATEQGQLT